MLLYNQITDLNKTTIKTTMRLFLKEDIPQRDITTELVIKKNQTGRYVFRTREKMVFCGGPIIKNTFSKAVRVDLLIKDGTALQPKRDIAIVEGNTREILTKERVILNTIQRLSGISTNTAKHVLKLNNPQIKILDTRKTTPGLRLFEKYAVNKGGGFNHRLDLSSGIMVKDNHIINQNINQIHNHLKNSPQKIPIQIEIDNINQITKDNTHKADAFLLDNMSPIEIKKCISKINKITKKQNFFIEVSGGINLQNILKYNIQGVHGISIGALTHQSKNIDIGLDFC